MSEIDIQIREAECPGCEAESLGFAEAVRDGVYFHCWPCEGSEEVHAR
jgi:hypothetical protein